MPDDSTTPAPPPPPPPPPAAATAVFDQTQVNAIAAREADQAARNARKKMLEDLGVDSADALKAILTAHRQQETANLTAQEQAAAAAATAAQETHARQAAEHGRQVDRALIAAGVPFGQLDRVGRLIAANPGDSDALAAEITQLKTELPALFALHPTPPSTPAPASEPAAGGPPPASSVQTGLLARGAERAKRDQQRATP